MNCRAALILSVCISGALFGCSVSRAYAPPASETHAVNPIKPVDTMAVCQAHLPAHEAGQSNPDFTVQEVVAAQSTIEAALALRAVTIDLAHDLDRKIDKGQPLSGHDLDLLNQGVVEYLKIREQLLQIARHHACWLDMSAETRVRYGLDEDNFNLGIYLSLATALVLYDNYLMGVALFEQNSKLRKVLNRKDTGYGLQKNSLNRIYLSYIEPENREKLRQAIRFYSERPASSLLTGREETQYLKILIEQSPSFHKVKTRQGLASLWRDLSLMQRLGVDTLKGLLKSGVNLFSSLFGNTVGLVETRRGKLHHDRSAYNYLAERLQPGDILLEKTPFRLTDKLIPGHWGHAAVWVGTQQQLAALGLQDDELVRRHWRRLGRGKSVAEALRSGVQLNTLRHFLNVDDVVVLRQAGLDDAGRRRIVIRALRQLGKYYDFNFDVETTDRIVCSELVYLSHTDIDWPTSNALGRATISPDQIAVRAGVDRPLIVVAMYLDGERISSGLAERLASVSR